MDTNPRRKLIVSSITALLLLSSILFLAEVKADPNDLEISNLYEPAGTPPPRANIAYEFLVEWTNDGSSSEDATVRLYADCDQSGTASESDTIFCLYHNSEFYFNASINKNTIYKIAEQLCGKTVDDITVGGSGANSRIYQVRCGKLYYALKFYRSESKSLLSRMEMEFLALKLFENHRIPSAPRIISIDKENNFQIQASL